MASDTSFVAEEYEFSVSDDKRFRVPGVTLSWTCGECGEHCSRSFDGDSYLSYPTANLPFEENLWCPECDYDEDTVTLQLNVSLELIED